MGHSSGSSSKGKDTSRSWTSESGLSKEQLSILQQRQAQYNQYFFPALQQGLEQSTPGSSVFTQQMGNNAQQVNAAFDSSQMQTNQILAQHRLLGSANGGTAAALKAQNERARASALANAYSSQVQNANADKQRFLQMGLGMSPQTTTAAPFHSQQEGQGTRTQSGPSVWQSAAADTAAYAGKKYIDSKL